jgi:hypothetical protein
MRVFICLQTALTLACLMTPAIAQTPAKSAVKLAKTEQFKTVAAAAAHCPGDAVVWSSLSGKAFHLSASKYYGKTKHGAYVCEKAAIAAGLHASKR